MIPKVFTIMLLAAKSRGFLFSSPSKTKTYMTNVVPTMSLMGFPYGRSLDTPRDAIGELLKNFDTISHNAVSSVPTMLMDVRGTKEDYQLLFEIAGVKKEDIVINQKDDLLTVTAEKRGMEKEDGDTFRRNERFVGIISRTITLPEDVNKENISAIYEHGVLKLRIPRMEYYDSDKLQKRIPID